MRGWVPDLPDRRDERYPHVSRRKVTGSVDLRGKAPAPWDQGQTGACVAFAVAGAFACGKVPSPAANGVSRRFLHLRARAQAGVQDSEAPVSIRDALKSLVRHGAPPEDAWPMVARHLNAEPPEAVCAKAAEHRIRRYVRLDAVPQMLHCLDAGHPFIFGFTAHEGMLRDCVARTGVLPLPGAWEKPVGGHACAAVGYDEARQCFLVRNSWGQEWGLGGYFWMPYAHLGTRGIIGDCWTIR